jgi:hypothetical protein
VLEKAASEVLSARDMYEGSSLADLYGGVSMPKELKKAHDSLDSLVLEFLGISTSASEIQILASLFSLYLGLQDEPLL